MHSARAWANSQKTRVDSYGPTGLEDMINSFWKFEQLDIGIRIEDEGKPDLRKLVFARRIPNGATLLKHLKESHTLTEDVGRIARAAGVKTLVLSHFVAGDDPSITQQMWESAVATNFRGKIIIGADLTEIPL